MWMWLWFLPGNLSRTEGQAVPIVRDNDGDTTSRSDRRALAARTARPRSHHPLSTDRGSEGHRAANCTDTRRFSVSRRSFQTALLPTPARALTLRQPPRGPWLLAQALVLFRGLRPILIHGGVSTVLFDSRGTSKISPFVLSSCSFNELWEAEIPYFFMYHDYFCGRSNWNHLSRKYYKDNFFVRLMNARSPNYLHPNKKYLWFSLWRFLFSYFTFVTKNLLYRK